MNKDDIVYIQLLLLFSHYVWLSCDPVDCSPPGCSVHGISQARILEWVTSSFSKGYSWPRDQTCYLLPWEADSLPLSHQGSPKFTQYSSTKKERKFALCNNVDGLGGRHVSEISQTEEGGYHVTAVICGILKTQQTRGRNKKEANPQKKESKPVVTSGDRDRAGGGNIGGGVEGTNY